MSQRTKAIYIMGAGRSGSTIFDLLLGSGATTVSCGELCHLHTAGWLKNEFCACGTPVGECAFWLEVRALLKADAKCLDANEFIECQKRLERTRSLLKPKALRQNSEFESYLHTLSSLYNAISTASGKPVIIDSSKKHVRALYGSMLKDVDFYVIHLVRDSRGVAWSKAKSLKKDMAAGVQSDQNPKPVTDTAQQWLIANILSSLVARRTGKRCIRIRYEDFVSDPVATLKQVESFAEVDLADSIECATGKRAVAASHAVAGNRLRMKKDLSLKPDMEWTEKLDANQERAVWRRTSWLLKRYGYQRTPG